MIWVGGLKFLADETPATMPLVAESPLLCWLYDVIDVRSLARLLGPAEILAGVAIALRPSYRGWPRSGAPSPPCSL